MSTSESNARATDFDRWIAAEFARTGAFTALAVLVEIGASTVRPLCSTYFNVIGDEVDWGEITVLFAGSGVSWNGAAFFPVVSPEGGPLANPAARARLREIESRINDDRLALNQGHFFDQWGRRLAIEEVALQ